MRRSSLTTFLLGLWLGMNIAVVAVVAMSFPGVKGAMEANSKLKDKADFDPNDEEALKTSVLWVYTGEQNRSYFYVWNRAQLVLAAVTFIVALLFLPRKAVLVPILAAVLIACALHFYLAPKITSLGRELDFVPRSPEPPPEMANFQMYHSVYSGLEFTKVVLLTIAAAFSLSGQKKKS